MLPSPLSPDELRTMYELATTGREEPTAFFHMTEEGLIMYTKNGQYLVVDDDEAEQDEGA